MSRRGTTREGFRRGSREQAGKAPVEEKVAGMVPIRRETGDEPDADGEEGLQKHAAFVDVDNGRIGVYTFGLHIDGAGADRGKADEKNWAACAHIVCRGVAAQIGRSLQIPDDDAVVHGGSFA